MAFDPSKVERYTTKLLLPIYAYSKTRWDKMIASVADMLDDVVGTVKDEVEAGRGAFDSLLARFNSQDSSISDMDIRVSGFEELVTSGETFKGAYDMSVGSYPVDPVQGDYWVISVEGTIGTNNFYVGNRLLYTNTQWVLIGGATHNSGLPTTPPSLLLDFANAKVLDPRITFTRSSVATYFDENGVMRTAAVDECRFHYDPSTGEALGIYREPAATNLLTYSEDFSNAAWLKSGSFATSQVSNIAVAPDGTTTADEYTNDDTGTNNFRKEFTVSESAYTYSIWLKAKSSLDVGKHVTVGGHLTSSVHNRLLVQLPSEWTRFEIGGLTPAGQWDYGVDGRTSGTFDGINQAQEAASFLAWGAQLETGSVATSYIKTEASTVTRAADVINMVGEDFTSWFNPEEGCFVVDYINFETDTAQAILSADDGTVNNRISILADGAGASGTTQSFVVTTTGVQQSSTTHGATTSGTNHCIAAMYSDVEFSAFTDTGTLERVETGTVPTVTALYIGNNGASTQPFLGTIKSITYYPVGLSYVYLPPLVHLSSENQSGVDSASLAATLAAEAARDIVLASAAQVSLDADQVAADRVQTGLDVVSSGNSAASASADRILAQAAAASSVTNALAAAASAASIADYSARVQAMLVTRGITVINAMLFKSAEGWEKFGNQSYKSHTRPTGRFLGDYANATAAWAQTDTLPATAAEDYFWNQAKQTQHKCTTLNASEESNRGGSDEMPAECLIVARHFSSSAALMIFDLTDPLMPLWMRFTAGNDESFLRRNYASLGNVEILSMSWIDGLLVLGMQPVSTSIGVRYIDFKNDKVCIANQNVVTVGEGISFGGSDIKWKRVRDIGDVAPSGVTGPMATYKDSRGHRWIFSSGNSSSSGGDRFAAWNVDANLAFTYEQEGVAVVISGGRLYGSRTTTPRQLIDFGPIDGMTSLTVQNTWTSATVPELSFSSFSLTGAADCLFVRASTGFDQLWPNPAVMADSLISRRSNLFATPPMKKPATMHLCSTVAGLVGASTEMVTNGTYDTDVTGWSLISGASSSVTWVAGKLRVTRGDSNNRGAISDTTITLLANREYVFSGEATKVSGGGGIDAWVLLATGTSEGSGGIGVSKTFTNSESGTWSINFRVSADTVVYVQLLVGDSVGAYDFDNVSVKEIVRDHSGNSLHAAVTGSLTKTAEVSGGVAGLSGWSAANYLSNAYIAALDVDTGDIMVMFAFKSSGNSTDETLFCRADAAHAGATIEGMLLTAGTVRVSINGTAILTTASTYDDGSVHTGLFYRRSGVAYLEIDGRLVASSANTTDLDNATAITRIGLRADGTLPATTTTLWFVGWSATSPSRAEADLMHKYMRNLITAKAAFDEITTFPIVQNPVNGAIEMVGATYHMTMIDGAIVSSVAHGVGSTSRIAVGLRGEIAIGGTQLITSVPARNLREYTPRLMKERFTVKYAGDATGSRVLFPLPTTADEMAVTIGAKPVRVSNAGVVQTEGAAEDYTVKDYGLGRYVVQFAVAPADANDVIIEFEREVWK